MNHPIVLHLIDSFGIGGAQQRLFNDLQFFGAEFEHWPFAIFGPAESGQAKDLRIPLRTLGLRRKRDLPFGVARLIGLLVKNPRIRIVHTQLFWADLMGRLAARGCGRTVVSTMQNAGHELDSGLYSAWRHRADRSTAGLLTRAVAVSEYVRQSVVRRLEVPGEKVVVIPNGVDTGKVRPDARRRLRARVELGLAPDQFAWLMLGRLVPLKGLADLLNAFAQTRAECKSAVLFMAGHGPFLASLQQQAAALGIGAHLRFLGARNDVLELLDAADAFVLPSLHEGLPVAVLEAMAMQKACLLSAIPPHAELVETGTDGLLVPPGDARALSLAMLRIQEDRAMREQLGGQARLRVVRAFDAAGCARQLQELYASVVSLPLNPVAIP